MKSKIFIISFFTVLGLAVIIGPYALAATAKPNPRLHGLDVTSQVAGYTNSLKDKGVDVSTILQRGIGMGLSMLSVALLLIMLYAGIRWMIARGNSEEVEKSKNIIEAALIGMIIMLAAWGIAGFAFSSLVKKPVYNACMCINRAGTKTCVDAPKATEESCQDLCAQDAYNTMPDSSGGDGDVPMFDLESDPLVSRTPLFTPSGCADFCYKGDGDCLASLGDISNPPSEEIYGLCVCSADNSCLDMYTTNADDCRAFCNGGGMSIISPGTLQENCAQLNLAPPGGACWFVDTGSCRSTPYQSDCRDLADAAGQGFEFMEGKTCAETTPPTPTNTVDPGNRCPVTGPCTLCQPTGDGLSGTEEFCNSFTSQEDCSNHPVECMWRPGT